MKHDLGHLQEVLSSGRFMKKKADTVPAPLDPSGAPVGVPAALPEQAAPPMAAPAMPPMDPAAMGAMGAVPPIDPATGMPVQGAPPADMGAAGQMPPEMQAMAVPPEAIGIPPEVPMPGQEEMPPEAMAAEPEGQPEGEPEAAPEGDAAQNEQITQLSQAIETLTDKVEELQAELRDTRGEIKSIGDADLGSVLDETDDLPLDKEPEIGEPEGRDVLEHMAASAKEPSLLQRLFGRRKSTAVH